MAGIYVHIPFCKTKCSYCNFFSTPSVKYRDEVLAALKKEITLQKDFLQQDVKTIYLGGGTPSIVATDHLLSLLDCIFENFQVVSNPEITIEANPDDIDRKKVSEWKATPINRISVGVQSFYDADLKWLQRIHSAQQSEYAVKLLQDSGFENLSIDLIYGIPTQNTNVFEKNLYKTLEMQVPHISCYAITVEPKTPLEFFIRNRKTVAPSDELVAEHFNTAMNILKKNNYVHYEISNFCIAGAESKHNISYWKGIPYLGIGPSAHSYDTMSRQWNCSSITQYLEAIEKNQIPCESEVLSETQKFNEYILTSLRTLEGCKLSYISEQFGEKYFQHTEQALHSVHEAWIHREADTITLTDKGKLFADSIIANLFYEED